LYPVEAALKDASEVRAAYQRLTEKFRTLWLFHQFLQGIQAVLPDGEPASAGPAFGPLYEQIKAVKDSRESRESSEVLAEIDRLLATLDGLHAALLLGDRRVAPHVLRQFFEKTGRDEEKDLVPLLRFYFYAKQLSPDDLDKIDFLLTRVGSHRLPDGGLELRPAVELEALSSALLALTRREPTDPAEVRSVVNILEVLRHDIDACARFEDLIRKRPLENIRTLKRRMGNAFFSPEVLKALLASNVAAKRKFQTLYAREENRILEKSRSLLAMERELELDTRFATEEFAAEFARFKRENEEFERQSRRRGVRARDVRRLKEAIYRILLKVEPGAAAEFDATPDTTAGGSTSAAVPAAAIRPAAGPPRDWRAEADPLTDAVAGRILHAVDLVGDGVAPGRASTSGAISNLSLEPWEFRAALDIVRLGRTPERGADPVTRLLFNAAALRIRMDEEARALRGHAEGDRTALPPGALDAASACLDRSQEIDRLFRASLLDAEEEGGGERHRQLTRSRFRHLRAFTGLWLLGNAFGG
jgi:hypothetical protein